MNTLKQKIVEIIAELEGGEGSKFEELTGVRKAYIEQETSHILSLFEAERAKMVKEIEELKREISATHFPDIRRGEYYSGFEAGKELAQSKIDQVLSILTKRE